MATRGLRKTGTLAKPSAASTPVSRDETVLRRGKGDVGSRRDGSADDKLLADHIGVLNHHHCLRAARDDGSRGDGNRRPRDDGAIGIHAGQYRGPDELQGPRAVFAGPECVLGPNREAVHIAAVEARHVDRRDDIFGQDSAQRRGKRHWLRGKRAQVEHGVEAALGLVPVDDVEELVLAHGRPSWCGRLACILASRRATDNTTSATARVGLTGGPRG